MTCPPIDTLERLALGFFEDEAPVRAHVSACAACAKRMAALDADHAALAAAAKDVVLPKVLRPAPRLAIPWKPIAAAAGLLLAAGVYMLTSVRGSAPAAPEETAAPRMARREQVKSKGDLRYDVYKLDAEQSVDEPMIRRPVEAPPPPSPAPLLPPPVAPAPKPEPPAATTFRNPGFNPGVDTAKETQSTFALDVDTASYAVARSYLQRGMRPPAESVRVEEYVNYFRYGDPAPADAGFLIRLEAAPSPFAKGKHLLRIGVRSKDVDDAARKDAVLTFVIDVSGSMQQENRLSLVKQSLHHLVDRLRPTDRVALVVYGTTAREVLPHTPLGEKDVVKRAIDALGNEGSTNVEDGLRFGYRRASLGFDKARTNRVVLCSDGVANNGVTSPDALLQEVRKHAGDGIYLSTIGFGMGNFNDHLMEKLADGGNGNYAYVDDFAEAKRMFGPRLTSMMDVIAADAKIQVEFDAATVASFRQIGYENRALANHQFRDDKVDAGEVGPGHQVTALYEIELKPEAAGRLVTVRLRYREPDTKEVVELQESTGRAQVKAAWTDASAGWRLAASVAAFGEILRGHPSMKDVRMEAVGETAGKAVEDLGRSEEAVEFLDLLRRAAALK